ncbi:unnamed protein product [Trifolium pratense]|uniref:Uncharacterized protein n=1 Tax=Trifolium pratense TaxID=57577 RepID=A0ACB0LWM6_TRIPR|nr:unnamed protein product [Trifolium pratense]
MFSLDCNPISIAVGVGVTVRDPYLEELPELLTGTTSFVAKICPYIVPYFIVLILFRLLLCTNSDYISRSVLSSNPKQGEEESIGVVDYWLKNHSDKDKVKAAFSKRGSDFEESSQKVVVKNPKKRLAKKPVKDQTARRIESVRSNRSGWRKLLNCCL